MKAALLSCAFLLTACSKSNNVLLGRVENHMGAHKVVVTDCYRTSVPAVELLPDSGWRWAPCRDAVIEIRREELEVNGRSYGKIAMADSIVVDHGIVSVHKD